MKQDLSHLIESFPKYLYGDDGELYTLTIQPGGRIDEFSRYHFEWDIGYMMVREGIRWLMQGNGKTLYFAALDLKNELKERNNGTGTQHRY